MQVVTKSIHHASLFQQQYWLNQRMHPQTSAYNISYIWKVEGSFDVNAFCSAVNGLVNTFDILRTKYRFDNQVLYQEISDHENYQPEVQTISRDQLNSHFAEFINRPFNLADEIPIRVNIAGVSPLEYYFSIVIHHVSTDLFTWYKVSEILSLYYKEITRGKELTLYVPEYQYCSYSERFQKWMGSEDCNKKLDFWKTFLRDLPVSIDFPVDKKRPKVFSNEGARKYFRLPSGISQSVKHFSDDEYIILFSNLLTAYALLIYRYSKQTRFAIGVPFTNRRQSEDQGVAGCFVNILPVTIDVDPEMPLKKFRSRIQKTLTEINRYQDIPYLQILNNLNIQFDPQFVPLFQFGFNY
jgi:hypothetical protein